MDLLLIHIVAASAWMGLIAAETVMELVAKSREARQFVADAHRVIDLLFEMPLFLIVITTGSVLLFQLDRDPGALLMIKVGAGLIAVLFNAFCVQWVLGRARAASDEEYLKYAHKIKLSGYAIPFGVLALVLGLWGV